MEKTAAGRPPRRKEETSLPPGWDETQKSLAGESGLALLLVEGHQPPQLLTSNNNSICHSFQSSPAHAHLCDPYCGEAYKRAHDRGETDFYRCHAGFHCFVTPVEPRGGGRPLAVIGGRAFLSGADYRELVERFRDGDLRELLSTDLFRNVLFASRADLEQLSARVAQEAASGSNPAPSAKAATFGPRLPSDNFAPSADSVAGESFTFTPGAGLLDASQSVLQTLAARHGSASYALLVRGEEGYTVTAASGRFKNRPPRVSVVREADGRRGAGGGRFVSESNAPELVVADDDEAAVFPLAVGEDVKGALVVGDARLDAEARRSIAELCQRIATPLELLRLREELERRMRVAYHLQSFTEQISALAPDEAYAAVLRHSTELLRSERGSLLLYDEGAQELQIKATTGPHARAEDETRVTLGEGVSGEVLREGRPLLVRDLSEAGRSPAPAERKYKTGSFISYPLAVGGRKVGVLNVTDKAGGGAYDDLDLRLLDVLAPQMALALDRAEWHQKATQFQLLSITDPLTGLLNRRYLEERLGEELERSKRHRFPMCFLMIDIDNFKDYNDRNGHQAGDAALNLAAQSLKAALRSADIASRYGGEEFSVLLPQTSLPEALVIAERIRARVEQSAFPHRGGQPGRAVTVSIGVSAFGPGLDTTASIVGAADQALYVAKSRGKNRVEAYTAPAPPARPASSPA